MDWDAAKEAFKEITLLTVQLRRLRLRLKDIPILVGAFPQLEDETAQKIHEAEARYAQQQDSLMREFGSILFYQIQDRIWRQVESERIPLEADQVADSVIIDRLGCATCIFAVSEKGWCRKYVDGAPNMFMAECKERLEI